MPKHAHFRFYEELNDFLPVHKRKTSFAYSFAGNPSVKDAIESIGVPHTEIDLILVDGTSVPFSHRLQDGDEISVYPVFESIDITPVSQLRKKPLREPRFILDVHLGKLARYLRMFGFDSAYENFFSDAAIVDRARKEKRIILTRDIEILKMKAVSHGYWIRSQVPAEQLEEVLRRFDLRTGIRPFHRCIACNGLIRKTTKEEVIHRLQPRTKRYFDEFFSCDSCGKIFWKGSHYVRMNRFVDSMMMKRLH